MQHLKLAELSDASRVLEMSLEFVSESQYRTQPIDLEKAKSLIHSFLTSPRETHVIILAMDDDRPIGMIVGQVSEILFNRNKHASEVMWWMDHSHRNSRLSLQLVDAYIFWAKRVGCKTLQITSLETDQTPSIHKFYSRRGFQLSEHNYMKDL